MTPKAAGRFPRKTKRSKKNNEKAGLPQSYGDECVIGSVYHRLSEPGMDEILRKKKEWGNKNR